MRTIKNDTYCTQSSIWGFTLIEMCIVIIITGLLLGGAASAYTMYIKDKRFSTTEDNLAYIVDAIGGFRSLEGRYPCPAPLTATNTDAEYGQEQCGAEPPAGTCANGICTETSIRNIAFNSGGASVTANPEVIVGAVPFRILNLPENIAYDGQGIRYKYVVTKHLTHSDNFEVDTGGIEILNDQGGSLFDLPGSGHFIVISHGEDKAGGYTRDGVKVPCPAALMESDNCTENRANATYRLAQISNASTNLDFDDRLMYFTKDEVPLWQYSSGSIMDVHQKPPGAVVFYASSTYTTDPMKRFSAESDGAVRASQNLLTNTICAADNTKCFPSEAIVGNLDGLNDIACPPGQVMDGINNVQATCEPMPEAWIKCQPGEALVGIKPDGSPDCLTPPPPPVQCPAQVVGICSGTGNLPVGTQGQTVRVTGTFQSWKDFRCNSSGTWQLINSNTSASACTCTSTTQTQNQSCGTGFTGTYQRQRTYQCPAGSWTSWTQVPGQTFLTNCNCVGATQQRPQNCPPNYSGSITEERTFTCTSSTSGTWGAWGVISNTCACTPQHQTRPRTCPGALTGTYYEERSLTCPAGSWSSWAEIPGQGIANNCSCVSKQEERARSCSGGLIGTYYELRDLQCPAGAWSSWYEDPARSAAANCTTPPPIICNVKRGQSPQGGASFGIGPPVGTQCNCGDVISGCNERQGSSYTNYTACTCQ